MAASSRHSSIFDVFHDPITKACTHRKRAKQNIIGFCCFFFFFDTRFYDEMYAFLSFPKLVRNRLKKKKKEKETVRDLSYDLSNIPQLIVSREQKYTKPNNECRNSYCSRGCFPSTLEHFWVLPKRQLEVRYSSCRRDVKERCAFCCCSPLLLVMLRTPPVAPLFA